MVVKNPHMVTKSYIRAWADAKNVLEVLDKQDGRGYRRSYLSATVVSYVYEPNVLTYDLEQAYADVEGDGMLAINKLCNDHSDLSEAERKAVVAFLDMHLDRGRYANQANILAPAIALKTDGEHENAGLNLGDLLLLSQYLPEVLRLSKLGIEEWPWEIWTTNGLVTGDGAVLLWGEPGSKEVTTISFPLSPTKLLVIGKDLQDVKWHNVKVTENSKRWIIGELGTLNLKFATADGFQK